jgi:hypothetical protein
MANDGGVSISSLGFLRGGAGGGSGRGGASLAHGLGAQQQL